MADISFTNLTNLPPDIATELENINRKRRIQEALMAQTLQQPQTQMTGGKYSRAVPYSPLQGATKLIQAAMLSKASDKSNQALRGLGQDYSAFNQEEIRNIEALRSGAGGRTPDPYSAGMYGIGSDSPPAQRVGSAIMGMEKNNRGAYSQPIEVSVNGKPQWMWANTRTQQLIPMTVQESEQMAAGTGQSAVPMPPKWSPPTVGAVEKEKAKQKELGGAEAETIIAQPKAQTKLETEKFKFQNLGEKVDLAINQAEGLAATGVGAQLTSWIGGTPAGDLAGTLSTIEAEAGFGRLQEMRDNSKTGGALGQVSTFELELLKASFQALKQSQSKPQLVENLKNFKKQYSESWKNINEAYKKDYGEYYFDPERDFGSKSTGPKPDAPIEDILEFLKNAK